MQHRHITLDHMPVDVQAVLGHVHRLDYPQRQGYTSDIALVLSAQGRLVVKRSYGSQYVAWLKQEHVVLVALAALELPVPVPQPFLFHQSTDVDAEAWLVMAWVPGEPIRAMLGATTDRAQRASIVHAWGATLAQLHATPAPPHWTHDAPWLDRMLQRGAYNLAHYGTDGDATLLDRLQHERPVPIAPTLIHGDFTVDNTLLAMGEVTGVIDWAGGAWGDPRYDLALAIRPKPGIFDERDAELFCEGYGRAPLSADEYQYFVDLYEFF